MRRFLVLLLTVSVLITNSSSKLSKQDEDIKRVGFAQFIVIDNIINGGGEPCSTKVNQQIRVAKDDAIRCLGNINITESYCKSIQSDVMYCVGPLVKKVEECNRDPILKGIIDATIKATLAEGEFVCKRDGEQVLELLNPCLFRTLEQNEPCVGNFMMDVQSVIRTKKKLVDVTCQAFYSLKKCLIKTIKSECPNEMTRASIKGLYNATVTPCNFVEEF